MCVSGVIMRGWGVCKWSDNEGVGCVSSEEGFKT